MKHVRTWLILCYALNQLAGNAFARCFPLSGMVYQAATNQPLSGATVSVNHFTDGSTQATMTNEAGRFTFAALPEGEYHLSIRYIGYVTQQLTVTVPTNGSTPVNIYLEASQVELKEVTVSPLRAHDQQLLSRVDIRLRPITNSQEIMRMVPGLFIGQHAGGGKAEQIFLRGFDLDHGTDINLSVDGMPVNMVSHAHGQGYADLHFVIPELVENVEFKKGPYQANKGNFTTAGWVDFHTTDILERNFIKVEGGPYNTFRGVGGVNLLSRKLKEKGHSAYVASEYSYSDAYFDHPQGFNRFNLVAKIPGEAYVCYPAYAHWLYLLQQVESFRPDS